TEELDHDNRIERYIKAGQFSAQIPGQFSAQINKKYVFAIAIAFGRDELTAGGVEKGISRQGQMDQYPIWIGSELFVSISTKSSLKLAVHAGPRSDTSHRISRT
ncbi:hypothetical protein, partial [Martelella sp. AD-3]|uniref:hypothetical protein n=1 Tax=Martelella sp. AD-3 TaxID=686597 RepID=UPI0005618842